MSNKGKMWDVNTRYKTGFWLKKMQRVNFRLPHFSPYSKPKLNKIRGFSLKGQCSAIL